jgi:predicted ester cyclase
MGLEENKALAARALQEVWNGSRALAPEAVYADGVVSHQPDGDVVGLDQLRAFLDGFLAALPDFTDTVEQQVAEGDLVVTRFTSAGTHRGVLLGMAPTGKRLTWTGLEMARVADGRIAELWLNWDRDGLLRQLGGGDA